MRHASNSRREEGEYAEDDEEDMEERDGDEHSRRSAFAWCGNTLWRCCRARAQLSTRQSACLLILWACAVGAFAWALAGTGGSGPPAACASALSSAASAVLYTGVSVASAIYAAYISRRARDREARRALSAGVDAYSQHARSYAAASANACSLALDAVGLAACAWLLTYAGNPLPDSLSQGGDTGGSVSAADRVACLRFENRGVFPVAAVLGVVSARVLVFMTLRLLVFVLQNLLWRFLKSCASSTTNVIHAFAAVYVACGACFCTRWLIGSGTPDQEEAETEDGFEFEDAERGRDCALVLRRRFAMAALLSLAATAPYFLPGTEAVRRARSIEVEAMWAVLWIHLAALYALLTGCGGAHVRLHRVPGLVALTGLLCASLAIAQLVRVSGAADSFHPSPSPSPHPPLPEDDGDTTQAELRLATFYAGLLLAVWSVWPIALSICMCATSFAYSISCRIVGVVLCAPMVPRRGLWEFRELRVDEVPSVAEGVLAGRGNVINGSGDGRGGVRAWDHNRPNGRLQIRADVESFRRFGVMVREAYPEIRAGAVPMFIPPKPGQRLAPLTGVPGHTGRGGVADFIACSSASSLPDTPPVLLFSEELSPCHPPQLHLLEPQPPSSLQIPPMDDSWSFTASPPSPLASDAAYSLLQATA